MNVFIHGSLNEQRLSSAFLLKLYLNKINNSNSEWLFNPYPSGKHLFLMTMWCDNLNIEEGQDENSEHGLQNPQKQLNDELLKVKLTGLLTTLLTHCAVNLNFYLQ